MGNPAYHNTSSVLAVHTMLFTSIRMYRVFIKIMVRVGLSQKCRTVQLDKLQDNPTLFHLNSGRRDSVSDLAGGLAGCGSLVDVTVP